MNTNTETKDHQIAELVNKLRDTAIRFHDSQQLRSRIQDAVLPVISDLRAEVARLQAALAEQDAQLAKKPCQYARCVEHNRLTAALADRDAKQVDKAGQFDWMNAERIRDEDHVDEALRAFREDPTGDNATGIIQAALTVWNADAAAIAQRVGCGEPIGVIKEGRFSNRFEWASDAIADDSTLIGAAVYATPPAAVTDADKRDAPLPACQCFTEQQEQYCVRQRKCQGKAVAYAAIAASKQANKREGV